MKITLVQSRGVVGDTKVNYFKAKMRISNVESDIFVFPEMYMSGYVKDVKSVNFPTMKVLAIDPLKELSHYSGATVICGCPTKNDDDTYSDCALIVDGRKTYTYAKMALRADNVTDETANYVPGSEPVIISRGGLSFGLTVGHDIMISDLCRSYSENGADMIICIAALTAEQMGPFMKIARARAIEFSIPILVCNMTGNDSGTEMGGLSALIGIDGEYIESCTSGSDVREIRLDPEEIKAQTAARMTIPKFDMSEHRIIEMETVEADPNSPACPLFG